MPVDFDDYDSYAPIETVPVTSARASAGRSRVIALALALAIGAVATVGVATAVVRRGSRSEATTVGPGVVVSLRRPDQMARPAEIPAQAAARPTTTDAAT